MRLLPLAAVVLLAASGALAQESRNGPQAGPGRGDPPAGKASMGELLSKGYEIKAAVPNGGKFVVFLQKRPVGLRLRDEVSDDIAVWDDKLTRREEECPFVD